VQPGVAQCPSDEALHPEEEPHHRQDPAAFCPVRIGMSSMGRPTNMEQALSLIGAQGARQPSNQLANQPTNQLELQTCWVFANENCKLWNAPKVNAIWKRALSVSQSAAQSVSKSFGWSVSQLVGWFQLTNSEWFLWFWWFSQDSVFGILRFLPVNPRIPKKMNPANLKWKIARFVSSNLENHVMNHGISVAESWDSEHWILRNFIHALLLMITWPVHQMTKEDARLQAWNCSCHSLPSHQNWSDEWLQIQNRNNWIIIIFFSSGFVEHQHLPQHDHSFQILLQQRTNGDGCQHRLASVLNSMSTGNDQQSIIISSSVICKNELTSF